MTFLPPLLFCFQGHYFNTQPSAAVHRSTQSIRRSQTPVYPSAPAAEPQQPFHQTFGYQTPHQSNTTSHQGYHVPNQCEFYTVYAVLDGQNKQFEMKW